MLSDEDIPPPAPRQIWSCTLCDRANRQSKLVSKHVTFVHEGKVYNHVPIMVCLNLKCLADRRAGTVVEHRVPARPNTNAY